MEKNPFTFSEANPRLATSNCERPANVALAAGLIFLGSLHLYNRRFMRVDGNLTNMMAFTAASVPAAYSYASFFFSSAEIEAGIMNNQREGH